MAQIWKYECGTPPNGEFVIEMPQGADILTLQMQGNGPCIWVEVDPGAEKTERFFKTYGTGHEMKEEAQKYVGTYQIRGGMLVFHVFEMLERG